MTDEERTAIAYAADALSYRTPKRPRKMDDTYHCPTCGLTIFDIKEYTPRKYCSYCGQRICRGDDADDAFEDLVFMVYDEDRRTLLRMLEVQE